MTTQRRRLVFLLGGIGLLAVLLVALSFVACGKEHASSVAGWHCPMHPTYVSDKPGDCPICGMRLVPMEGDVKTAQGEGTVGTPPPAADRKPLFYRHPMNPSVTSPVPAKDEMGMDYVPVYADEQAPAPTVDGLAPIQITTKGVQLTGVQTAAATRGRVGRATRTVGLVTADERRIRHIHTRITGWVEKLYVNYTGQPVRAGQPILSIYSPELLASQEELLRAREAAARFGDSSLPEVRRGAEDLVSAARRRLELFDVPRSFIAEVERSGKTRRAVTLTAPTSGFVTAKEVFEGQEVQPGMELFTLTDLSHVWVEAQFYEYEARQLHIGQRAEIQLPYDPGHAIAAQVSFIYPTLEPESRTLKVRLELDNPAGALRPGMYVDVVSDLAEGAGVVIPDDAVIDSGTRQVVFVEREKGTFEPRAVTLGVRGDGKAVVASGLEEGERVAIHANFLLDSESRLRAAIASSMSQSKPPAPAPSPNHSGHSGR